MRNPGSEHDGTRHNVGEPVARRVAGQTKFKRAPKRIRAQIAETRVGERTATLALPTTYMNESGGPVAGLVDYYGIELGQLVVIHDDIDLPFGRLRFQFDRGPGGHNGVASVAKSLGSREFWRLKIGVGRPPGRMDPADFVLRRFTKKEQSDVESLVVEAADVLVAFATDGDEAARQYAGDATQRLGIDSSSSD
ncbi:MAG: aminoacyl-tRNA hydrolase [Acidimicrobiia bacterium]